MKRNFNVIVTSCFLLVCLSASSAMAGTVHLDYVTRKGGTYSVKIKDFYNNANHPLTGANSTNVYTGSGGAGLFKFNVLDATKPAYSEGGFVYGFCIEFPEHIWNNSTPVYDETIMEVAPINSAGYFPSGMGGVKSDLLSLWWGQHFDNNWISNYGALSTNEILEINAFQIGVWEIIYEHLDTLPDISSASTSSGNFEVTSAPAGSVSLANSWLANLDLVTPSAGLLALTNHDGLTKHQDYGVLLPSSSQIVPLPVAFLAGLPLLGLVAYKRRQR